MFPKAVLSIAIKPLVADWGTSTTLVPVINGFDLTDLIRGYERAHRFRPAGAYAGLVPGDADVGSLDEYLMWDPAYGQPRERFYSVVIAASLAAGRWWPPSLRRMAKSPGINFVSRSGPIGIMQPSVNWSSSKSNTYAPCAMSSPDSGPLALGKISSGTVACSLAQLATVD